MRGPFDLGRAPFGVQMELAGAVNHQRSHLAERLQGRSNVVASKGAAVGPIVDFRRCEIEDPQRAPCRIPFGTTLTSMLWRCNEAQRVGGCESISMVRTMASRRCS